MKNNFAAILLSITLVIIDQLSKILVSFYIPIDKSKEILTFLYMVQYKKTGIVYQNYLLGIFITIILPICTLIFIIGSLIKFKNYHKVQRYSLWLISAGVFSNVLDRIFRNGNILNICKIQITHFTYEFNIAYLSVALYSIIMVLSLIIKDRSLT